MSLPINRKNSLQNFFSIVCHQIRKACEPTDVRGRKVPSRFPRRFPPNTGAP